ncbi:MAG: efflux transporter periplasmic adaptor subunit, partial [bacterium]
MSRLPIRLLKVLLPLVVVTGAGLAAYAMFLSRPPVVTQAPVIEPPSVRVQRVTFDTVTLTVSSQGTVQPRTSSQLVPEISGPVIEVAPSFAVGGFFEAGDVLLRIDPYDYQQAVITGRSQLAQAELRLAQEEA